jgi:hypothetical protein
VIRAGWRASGLCPFNINLVLQSSQIIGRPITPPPQNQPIKSIEAIYRTPQSHRDIYQAQQALARSESVSRSTRLILHKAGKAISIANTRSATLEADNKRLQYQLDQLGSQRKRKRIYIDPYIRFANIEKIRSTIHESAIEAADSSAKSTEKAAEAAAAAAVASTLQNMCTEWQL